MIELYTYATPNGRKAAIMLEEVALPYRVHVVDIERGDQRAADFVVMSPNGKIPVIVDGPHTVFESGAILLYLAEKSGRLRPGPATLEWMFFQAAHLGPMIGQLWHFRVFAGEPMPYAVARYDREVRRLFAVLDGRLATRPYLDDDFGLADIMCWPWVDAAPTIGLALDGYHHLTRWHAEVGARPAVRRGAAVLSSRASRRPDPGCALVLGPAALTFEIGHQSLGSRAPARDKGGPR